MLRLFIKVLPNLRNLHKLLDYFYSCLTIADAYSLQYDVCSESHSSKFRIVTHLVTNIEEEEVEEEEEEFKENESSSTKIVKQLK